MSIPPILLAARRPASTGHARTGRKDAEVGAEMVDALAASIEQEIHAS